MDTLRFLLSNVIWVLPATLVAGGLLLGIVLEKIITRELRKLAEKSQNKIPQIIMRTIRGIITLWLLIAGIYWAIPLFPLSKNLILVLHKILAIIVLWSGTITLARIAEGSIRFYAEQQKGHMQSTTIIVNITRGVIIIFGGIFLLQTLGISITPILTALGVGGLAVALALQDTLSNLFSGVQTILTRNVRPGDYIRLDSGVEGYVSDITWRSTIIRVPHKSMVIVPNAKMASAIVTNFHMPKRELNMEVPVAVGYGSDLSQVERVTTEVATQVLKNTPGAVADFKPVIFFEHFGDSAIQMKVVLRAKEFSDQMPIRHELIKHLHERYQHEKIEIPYPTRTIYLEKE